MESLQKEGLGRDPFASLKISAAGSRPFNYAQGHAR